MDWDKLRIFHYVASEGSFTHAGQKLNLSQSAISRQISSLEDSLGVALFHRHARGLILTEQGEILFSTTQDIFKKLTHIEGQIIDTRKQSSGPLMVTTIEFFATTWLFPKLPLLREQNPNLQLTLLFDDRILNLGMREADVALRMSKPDQDDLIQRHLCSVGFHICASKDYLDKRGRPKTMLDLRGHWLLGYATQANQPYSDINWLFDEVGIDTAHDNVMLMNSINSMIHAVKNHVGIAVLPDYVIMNDPDLEVIIPDKTRPDVDLYFVYAEERRNSQRIATFRDFLLQHIAKTKFKL
ncbi:MAG: LysR family transcriptional regulator [Alphaproteobacteria bacterium]